MDRDLSGATWLVPLMRLGPRSGDLDLSPARLVASQGRWWGENERGLDPPIELLRWLVQHLTAPPNEKSWGAGEVGDLRRKLVAKDQPTVARALELLHERVPSRAWYVLEGRSFPDAYLESESFVLVIEGKFTEPHATTSTTWMRCRSQILRHMDAAEAQLHGAKRVYGLMIVEASRPDVDAPNHKWLAAADEQICTELLQGSLPHRTEDERRRTASAFLGVTTWQRICRAFQLPLRLDPA